MEAENINLTVEKRRVVTIAKEVRREGRTVKGYRGTIE
jgi:hypothetical protein